MKTITTLLFVAITICAFGQRKIIGRAIDVESQLPIKNLRVLIEASDHETFTNYLGFFELAIEDSIKTIIVDHISYGTSEIVVPKENRFMFTLPKKVLEIEAIKIRAAFGDTDDIASRDSVVSQANETISVGFKGGHEGLETYLSRNIMIPEEVEDEFIFTRPDSMFSAEVTLTVNKDGKATDVRISGDTLLDMGKIIHKAISSTTWKPALQRGEACDQRIKFMMYYGHPVYVVIDNHATFPKAGAIVASGGSIVDLAAFHEYLKKNRIYPKHAKRMGIEGTVYVQFIISKKGKILRDSVKVVKGVASSLDQEAVRLVSNCPDWNPASHRGLNVYQSMVVPVKFE